MCECIPINQGVKDAHYDTFHVLSRCVFIPNKFPTLLAEREIIANALLYSDKIIPPPCAQRTRRGMRLKRHRGDISLQNYDLARTIQNKMGFIFIAECKNSACTRLDKHYST